MVAAAALATYACRDEPTGVGGQVLFDVVVEPGGAWLAPDDSILLSATVLMFQGATGAVQEVDSAVAWSSSDETVATVEADGWVRAVGLGEATVTASGAGESSDALIAVTEPGFPDVRGDWAGQYQASSCVLEGATDPLFCDDIFFDGSSLIVWLELDQLGERLGAELAQGSVSGFVVGTMSADSALELSGAIGGSEIGGQTTIVDWDTQWFGDSIVGTWQFLAEDLSNSGFGTATVTANIKLLAPGVPQFFGCLAEAELTVGVDTDAALGAGDCQLDDASYFDAYLLSGAAGDSLEIVMRSTSVDAFLLVADLDETVVGSDDDSGGPGATDAAITVVFDADGSALVIAGETGAYTLSATLLGQAGPGAGASSPYGASGRSFRAVGGGRSKDVVSIPGRRPTLGELIARAPGRVIKK
jgi:hypothetical protein